MSRAFKISVAVGLTVLAIGLIAISMAPTIATWSGLS